MGVWNIMTDEAIIRLLRRILPHLPKSGTFTERQAKTIIEKSGYRKMVKKNEYEVTMKKLKKRRDRDKAMFGSLGLVLDRLRPEEVVTEEQLNMWIDLFREVVGDNENLLALWMLNILTKDGKDEEEALHVWEESMTYWGKYMIETAKIGPRVWLMTVVFLTTMSARFPVVTERGEEE